MSSIILHISDLHVSLDKDFDDTPKKHDSYLSANENDGSSLYIEKFLEFVKNQIKESNIYLIITGDITDWGEQREFHFAEKFLEEIVNSLKIDKQNILLIPGDHDVNRRSLVNLAASNPDSSIKEKNDAKYLNFCNFYSSFLGKTFDPNLVIFDSLIIGEKIQLLGLNSSFKIDLTQKLGAIPIEQFQTEFKSKYNSGHLKNIICCHHNITSSHEDKKSGQWEPDNRRRLMAKLLENNINFIFSGNEHTSSLEKVAEGEITISDSGPLTSKKHDSAFKIYELIEDDNDIILNNKIFGLVRTGTFENPYHWEPRNNALCRQDETLKIFIKESPPTPADITELIDKSVEKIKTTPEAPSQSYGSTKVYYNQAYTDVLYEKIKELQIFHSGHFHWSETSRAHNWIDISKLIENKDNLNFLKNSVIDVFEKMIGAENVDLIIGLGYEGNILATKASIKYDKAYSFLPYSYRHDEHHEFETELNFENSQNRYGKVLIVTDVVNDGRTIRKLINKRQKEFFSNVDKIYVISLLYTGESTLNHDILNFDFIKTIPNYDLESDEEVTNIEFYTVKSLKVEKCPYGKNFREECFIYKDELSCVNLFYDEKKYLKK